LYKFLRKKGHLERKDSEQQPSPREETSERPRGNPPPRREPLICKSLQKERELLAWAAMSYRKGNRIWKGGESEGGYRALEEKTLGGERRCQEKGKKSDEKRKPGRHRLCFPQGKDGGACILVFLRGRIFLGKEGDRTRKKRGESNGKKKDP